MNTDDKLRAILRSEAETFEPSAAGWDAIRTGVAERRRRTWWLRGSAFAVTATAVVAALLFVDLDHSRDTLHPATPGPSVATSAPAPSASPTGRAVAADPTPVGAIWPLTTRDEVRRWEADRATYPSLATENGSALAFARTYVGVKDATVVPRGSGQFDVTRPLNGAPHVVTTLTVAGFGGDGGAPFLVTLATSAEVAIGTPAAGAAVASPLAAHGTYRTVDPSFTVTLRADGPGSAPVDLASGHAVTGPPDGWDVTLPFTTAAGTGSLLVTNPSLADGGLAGAAAVPVTFASGPAAPATFAATVGGRVAVLSSATGAVVRYLTAAGSAGAGGAALSADGQTAVFATGGGCGNSIRSVPFAGGAERTLVAARPGYVVESPSQSGEVFAYRQRACAGGAPAGNGGEVVVSNSSTTPRVIAVDGTVVAGPVAGQRLVSYVVARNGVTTLHTVDSTGELADAVAAPPTGCDWLAATPSVPGDDPLAQPLVTAARCGADTRVYRTSSEGRDPVLLGHAGTLSVVSLDYPADGAHLLLGAREGTAFGTYAYEGGVAHRIPGTAAYPTW
jgi:hypothetical protein